jgi:hypothetical protein
LFAVIGLPQADDAAVLAARRPNQNDHAVAKHPDRNEPIFTIGAAIVRDGQGRPGEDIASQRHVEAAVVEGGLSL